MKHIKKREMKKFEDKDNLNPFNSAISRIALSFIFCLLSSIPFGKGWGGALFAQQMPFSSQYYSNPFAINPAYAGINEHINVFLTHRSQWTGLAGAPQTSYFTIDGPVRLKNSNLGLKLYSDVTDIISRVGAFANYSYKFKISDSTSLHVGLAGGVFDNKIDFSKAQVKDTDDPFLSQQSQNKTVVSADFGIVFVRKKLTIGFAVPQILGNRLNYPIATGGNSYYNLNRHYQGSFKYLFDVSKEKEITAYPLIMVRSVKGAPFQYDINGVIDWKKIGWLGLTYHSNYAMALSAGVRYRNFSVGYAFDIGISKISSYTGSTSEFLLGYIFQNKKDQERFVKVDEQRTDISALSGNGKTDSLQLLRAQLKANDDFNMALAAKLKAMSDSNQAEIDRLKAELEKAKTVGTITPGEDSKNTASITIRLVDEKNNPISDAEVKVTDAATKTVIATPKIEKDGNFHMSVPAGKPVEVLITKSGYLYKSFNLTPDLPGSEKKLNDVTLEKVEVGKKRVMNNIAFELNQYKVGESSFSELDNAVKLMKDIPSLEIEISGHTDNTGPASNNDRLSKLRAKAVQDYIISKGGDKNRITYQGYGSRQPIAENDTKEGRMLNRRTEFKVLKVNPEYNIETGSAKQKLSTILAIPEKEKKEDTSRKLEVGKKIVPNNVSFDVNETTLRPESFPELDVFVKLMKDVPSLEIEISGHTDNLGSATKNEQLSAQRAKAVLDYLLSKGVDKNRMTYKGYGSSDPIETNTTIDGRKKNRRIEFKVLKVAPGYSIESGISPSNSVDPTKVVKPASKKKKKQSQSKAKSKKKSVKFL